MDWLNGFDLSYSFEWYIVLPNLLYLAAVPLLLCRFFCLLGGGSFRWRFGIGYTVLSAALSVLEASAELPGSIGLFLEVLLLTCYGTLVIRRPWREAGMMSLLLRSVFGITDGIVTWSDRILFPIVIKNEMLIRPADAARELLGVLFMTGLLTLILRHFHRSRTGMSREQCLLLAVPLFFIALVERVMQDAFYGDTVVVDTEAGTFSSVIHVSHGDNLLLQLAAGACLFVMLLIWQRLARIQQTEKKLLCLSGQAAEQKRYMEEAALREQQTRAFRHDLQNHLTVLRELLKTGQTEKAGGYLDQLAESAEALSGSVRTGNQTADVLLGSKCAAAKQKGVEVFCELAVPEESGVPDLDWCILLSNIFDNALAACEAVPPGKRYLRLSGKKKGNFYLLLSENSCDDTLKCPPPEGTGLSNIRTVLEPLGGTMEKTVLDGVYKLKLLFLLPQQEKGSLRQTAQPERKLCR